MKSAYDIIKKPVLTEKSYDAMADKKYTFEVAIGANKTEIKGAIEAIFDGVKVESVESFHDFGMIGNLKIRNNRLAISLNFDIFAVVFSDRNRRVDYVRNLHHDFGYFCAKFFFLLLKFS